MVDNPLSSFAQWVRNGYPDGVPEHDYVALIGILGRRLTKAEIDEVAHRLIADGELNASEEKLRELITSVANSPPSDVEVRRVASRLAAGGWPLEGVASDPA